MATPVAQAVVRSERRDRVRGQAWAIGLASAIALAAGALIILGYGENPLEVYAAILRFSFTEPDGLAYVLAIATPLIFSALAVAICFKAGLFNIGVEGQYLFAMIIAAWAALKLDFIPGPLLVWVVLLAGMLGGVAYAAVPAILKVKTGAHEVVTTIMMNGAAASLIAWALHHPLRYNPPGQTLEVQTAPFPPNARIPDLGTVLGFGRAPHLSWLFPIAIVAAVAIWFVLRRTRTGYEARAVGASPGAAQAGGISIGGVQIKVFVISGALAGLVGMQQMLADKGILALSYESLLGFTGIAVAFLARNNPIGIIFAAFAWGVLTRGEVALQIETNMPREFIIILQGILILAVVITYEVARRRLRARQLRREADVDALAPPPTAPTPTEEAA
jgi:simple sugar transport system permease protein